MARATLDDLLTADRIVLHGVTGSGKSTAAVRLGAVLGLPVHFVDDEIGWLPDWVSRPTAEMRDLAQRITGEPRWVLDSTYSSFRDVIAPRIQLVVGLDYSRSRTLARLVLRTARRIITREQVCNGNVESLSRTLGADSILRWHHRSFPGKRATLGAWILDPHGPAVLRLRHPRDLDRLLAVLAARRVATSRAERSAGNDCAPSRSTAVSS